MTSARAPRAAALRPRTGPVSIVLPGRTLLLVAGMPGAGKSRLLARLRGTVDVEVVDSQAYRDTVAWWLPGGLPYRRYRALVHLLHRLAIVRAALTGPAAVAVHLPATSAATRATVALLAVLTGRATHLLWLDVDPADALRGQRRRGRTVPAGSFARHACRAAATTSALQAGRVPAGWRSVTVLDRAGARDGIVLHAGQHQ